MREFFGELKRRNVVKVAIVYATGAAAVISTAAVLGDQFNIEKAAILVTILAGLGFPIALVMAWAYELTPDSASALPANPPFRLPSAGAELASIAVLPFRTLTPAQEVSYLAEALPLEINNVLSRVHNLRVISNRATIGQDTSGPELGSLAQRLGVQYAITGAVAQAGERVRVITELGDAETSSMLWTRTFEFDVTDLNRIPQEIAVAVVSEFGGERLRAEIAKLSALAPRSATAWQCVQMSRAYLIDYNETNLVKAIASLKRALKRDPGYAVAHATLGQVLAERTLAGISIDPDDDRHEALAAVQQAERLAPRDPVVLRAAGSVHAYIGDYRRSIELLRRAIELAPYDFGTWGYLGWPLVATGRSSDLDELSAIVDRLLDSAPHHPGRPYWLFHRSVALLCAGSPEEAVAPAQQALSEQPNFSIGMMHLANVQGTIGLQEDAHRSVRRCLSLNLRFTVDYYADLMRVLSDQPSVIQARTAGLQRAGLLTPRDSAHDEPSESV